MPQKMLQFISVDKKMPAKRAADDRVEDFGEIYQEFSQELATEQAARCSQCGIPFCQVHCPLSNNIPDWLRMTAEGRLEEAYELASATNNMPEICGRICPQDRLCEGNCVIEKDFDSVTIGTVEKFITETAWKEGWVKPPTPKAELGQSIGIIGGGPAGLAAAEEMRRIGYEVHVYDRYDRMGGLLIYGIPSFKLEKEVVQRRTDLLAEGGVIYHTDFEVGRDATLADLRERHDAVLIATGVYNTREVQLPGSGLKNTIQAIDYLTVSNKVGLGDTVPEFESGSLDAKDKNIVVIGGGDTAMDCVRTAIRQGAKSVKCLYRRDRANMPGSLREVKNAEEEGVEFVWLTAPEAFIGDENGENGEENVVAVRAVKMRLGSPDATGRQTPKVIEGSAHNIDAELVIKALGFDPDDIPSLFDAPELGVSRWGTVQIDHRSMMTNIDGVFAAGDIVRGAALVVWAIRDGRDAALRMDRYLTQKRNGMERQFQAAE